MELVEDDSPPEGQYLLRMYDNNYWSLSTRDDYEPELPDSVGTSLTGGSGIHSYVTYYLVDSNAKNLLSGQAVSRHLFQHRFKRPVL